MSVEQAGGRTESLSSTNLYKKSVMKECDVDWCANRARSRIADYCEKHYYQLRRTGSILPEAPTYNQCQQCSTPTASTKFCSRRCQTRYSRSRIEEVRDCKVCGNKIQSDNRSDKVFCSTACKSKFRYHENPEKFQVYSAIRRARKKNSEGDFTYAEWQAILEWHDNKCLACGEFGKMSKDHVKPLSKGGSSYIWNIQPLCLPCNLKKHDKEIDYRTDVDREYYYSVVNYLVDTQP